MSENVLMQSGHTVRFKRELEVGVVRSVQGHLNVQVGGVVIAEIICTGAGKTFQFQTIFELDPHVYGSEEACFLAFCDSLFYR